MTPSSPCAPAAPPLIDGVLDDAAWREAQPLTGFKSFIPDFGKEPSERTLAYMAYDAENLYFAFHCLDRSPDKIKATMASRDTINTDDFVCINLDSFNDQQASYGFYVNPLGIQADSRYAGNTEDFSADFVWSSAGRLGPDGYAVELRIPFKSMRYAGKERVEMGIIFERYISRSTEHWSYPELDPAKGYAFLSQMQPLELRDIRRYTLLEVLPSAVYDLRYERNAGRLERSESKGELGVSAKLGLTSKLILDLTWNPDFSQIESDAGQVGRQPAQRPLLHREAAVLPRGQRHLPAGRNELLPGRRSHPAHRRPAAGIQAVGQAGRPQHPGGHLRHRRGRGQPPARRRPGRRTRPSPFSATSAP